MPRSSKRALFLIITCVLLITARAAAWEFSMDDAFYRQHELYPQTGSKGFFRNPEIANPAQHTLFSAPNGWFSIHAEEELPVTGGDTTAGTQYMKINPAIKLNEAIRIKGNYYVGSLLPHGQSGSPGMSTRSEYFASDGCGVDRCFSPGYWRSLWLSAQLPWVTFVVGKRPAQVGAGMPQDGESDFTSESTLLHVPYGPYSFGAYWYPSIRSSWGSPYPVPRSGNRRRNLVGSYGQYTSGRTSLGVILDYSRDHSGPESRTAVNDWPAYQALDENLMNGVFFLKYNNGHLFLNSEAVYWIYNQSLSPSPDGIRMGSCFQQDHWSGMVELGAIAGHARLSLLWAHYPGPDRRHGDLIDRLPFASAARLNGGASIFRPYSLIMNYQYGTGNNSFTLSGRNGFISDANVYGIRSDLAVAANFNVFGTFLWAERISHGCGWGFVRLDPYAYSQVGYDTWDDFSDRAPAIPNGDLGYEAGLGFNWKWLEGHTLSGTFGIWQPGKWFHFACADNSVSNRGNPTAANNFGVNPSRTINPVFGMQVLLKAEF